MLLRTRQAQAKSPSAAKSALSALPHVMAEPLWWVASGFIPFFRDGSTRSLRNMMAPAIPSAAAEIRWIARMASYSASEHTGLLPVKPPYIGGGRTRQTVYPNDFAGTLTSAAQD